MGLGLLAGGCAHSGPLKVRIDRNVKIPPKRAIVLFADGVRADLCEQMVEAGELPNLKKYIYDRGCRARCGVACLPTITYAVTASLTTGQFPGHHEIMGNRWFDRHSGQFQDYRYIRTYQQVNQDIRSLTIFELLNDKYTVAIQTANYLGATRPIENWISSGINWFFQRWLAVDQLVAIRFELIAKIANVTGRWPDFILAYFPAVDETGHRSGADSKQYRRALVNLDEQIGRICRALAEAGLLDEYYLFFTSDHGHVPAAHRDYFSLEDFFEEQLGIHVLDHMFMENKSS
jgi:predicted AlkP superfamily pyrophosphatase or phosphodiesterase